MLGGRRNHLGGDQFPLWPAFLSCALLHAKMVMGEYAQLTHFADAVIMSSRSIPGGFPSYTDFSQPSSGFLLTPISYPKPDLAPLTVHFEDPSLRNYPDPSVPSAAVQPILGKRFDQVESTNRKMLKRLQAALLSYSPAATFARCTRPLCTSDPTRTSRSRSTPSSGGRSCRT